MLAYLFSSLAVLSAMAIFRWKINEDKIDMHIDYTHRLIDDYYYKITIVDEPKIRTLSTEEITQERLEAIIKEIENIEGKEKFNAYLHKIKREQTMIKVLEQKGQAIKRLFNFPVCVGGLIFVIYIFFSEAMGMILTSFSIYSINLVPFPPLIAIIFCMINIFKLFNFSYKS